jgi:hypothetical protein
MDGWKSEEELDVMCSTRTVFSGRSKNIQIINQPPLSEDLVDAQISAEDRSAHLLDIHICVLWKRVKGSRR